MGCILDLSNGKITFTSDATHGSHYSTDMDSDKKEVTFIAHAGAKLFPTVIITPSSEDVVDFDFTPCQNCRSLSSYFITPIHMNREKDEYTIPLCPPRLKLMIYSKSLWVRQYPKSSNYSTESSINGPLKVVTQEMEFDIMVTLPQEDIVMDILEISEDLDLMDFHVRTLEAFCAVCSHSNLSLTKSIARYIDSEQLLRCLQVSEWL